MEKCKILLHHDTFPFFEEQWTHQICILHTDRRFTANLRCCVVRHVYPNPGIDFSPWMDSQKIYQFSNVYENLCTHIFMNNYSILPYVLMGTRFQPGKNTCFSLEYQCSANCLQLNRTISLKVFSFLNITAHKIWLTNFHSALAWAFCVCRICSDLFLHRNILNKIDALITNHIY